MKNTMRWFYLFTAVTLFSSRATEAAMITYDFEATVTSVADYSSGHTLIPASIHVGSIESGSFSFDDTAPGSPYVRGTALNLTATVTIDGTYTYTLSLPTSSDEIDVGLGGVYKRGPTSTTSFDSPVSVLEFFNLQASSNDLSTVQFTAPTGSGATVGISDAGEQSYYYIGATITSLQPASVPEPASLALFGSGIACLVGYRSWRRRKAAKV